MDRFIKRKDLSEHPLWSSVIRCTKKKLILSIVSLVIATVVLTTGTFCWFSLVRATGDADNIALEAGRGLRVNDIGENEHNITDDAYLHPASSVDGRNLYFPADGLPFTNVTNDGMLFRSANAGDRNYNYVHLDFVLTAEADYTSIYLDKEASLKVKIDNGDSVAVQNAKKKAEKAIRAAVFYEGIPQNKPIVFSSQNKTVTTMALDEIDRTTGKFISKKKQVAVPFRDYTYGKRTLATLNRGESKHFSLLIWLEGTDEVNCTSDPVMLKQLELNLKFTTSWDNTERITFADKTQGSSIKTFLNNQRYSLVLNYNNKAHNIDNYQFTMYKSNEAPNGDEWYCNIPGNAYNDLSFRIVDGKDGSVVYCWTQNKNGRSTLNRGTSTSYYAEELVIDNLAENNASKGHWYDGDIEDHGEGGDSGEIGDGW